jgi:AcrR family transcriptional regulator
LDHTALTNHSPFSRGLQRETKRAAVLSCAAKLLNTKGARSTTLTDIASRLGLTKTSLYYYVSNKEDLIYQCYQANMQQAHDQLDFAVQQHTAPLACLLAFFEGQIAKTLRSIDGEGDFYAAPLEFASLKTEHRTVLEAAYRQLLGRLIDLLRRGIELGHIRPCDPIVTIRAMIGAMDWSFYWLYEMPRDEAEQVIEVVRDLLTHGLLHPNNDYRPGQQADLAIFSEQEPAFDRDTQNRLKQEAFLKAGTRCFNRKGFSGTSLDEIVEQLNVSKGAFYYHFANKEALLTQCYDYTLDQLERVIAHVEHIDASPAARLDVAMRLIFSLQNSEQGPLIHFNSITALPPDVRRRLLDRLNAVHGTLEAFITSATAASQFRALPAGIVIQLLTGTLNAAIDLNEWQAIDSIDQSAIDYCALFFHGLAPAAAP